MNKNTKGKSASFSESERKAIGDRAKELAAEAKMGKNRAAGEKAVLDAITKMSGSDRTIAKRLHVLIKKSAPDLMPKTWYGFPAYADKEGKVVCFFQYAGKFKSRYATLGFNDNAKLDEGDMWPVAFALKKLTATEEKKIAELVKKAVR